MPLYTYYDEETGFEKDVRHPISELEKPTQSTIKEITHEGRVMKRKISMPYYASFSSKSSDEKKKILKQRSSSLDFQKNREVKDRRDYIKDEDTRRS